MRPIDKYTSNFGSFTQFKIEGSSSWEWVDGRYAGNDVDMDTGTLGAGFGCQCSLTNATTLRVYGFNMRIYIILETSINVHLIFRGKIYSQAKMDQQDSSKYIINCSNSQSVIYAAQAVSCQASRQILVQYARTAVIAACYQYMVL